ncbi:MULTISPECIES: hypothetical protein [Pseudomonas]|uniref:Uncharacterized protein n=1 Tax=Pseudomonas putida TaxID=303 RepID=A0A1L7NEU2_PSEPU|nr:MULTISPECIES: hypothetical protein [Pseudomonas]MBP2091708.1 hypothetical protein [Pseudomonas sp. PvP088]MBP2222129.1 hypothetical protein [Pseudomonas putida]MBS3184525.1 hypothetical protein [Pseudomonas sp. PCH44]PMY81855.1 hypothetical protein C1X72_07615 [Pseudomonas sp. FW306-2-2C-D06B]BAW23977.1 Uncharacterized protein KF715C_ch34040 [Pseudomonas putida]
MTEVHRYKVIKMLSEGGNRISYDPHGPEVVMAEAYDQLRAENDGLRKALLEASEEVATWGAYASEYFQEKHDLAGCVAKLHAAAMAKEASHG